MTTRALVVHPDLPAAGSTRTAEACLDEAVGLAAAIGLEVVHCEAIRTKRPRPATLLGGGVVDRLARFVKSDEIAVTIVDHGLTPIQQRNLERALDCKVIDRTGLILEIFGARARTREGQLQVELAALSYQRSRLVRSWTHLERQRGGFGFLGGPGESQLEIDRRLITDRMARLHNDLEKVKRTRTLHRAARRRVPFPVIALVGYTNAGKSTLFNRLTAAQTFAQDLLFATLDPTMRRLELPSGRCVILSDTVGFISDLPTELIAAFRATLEEVTEADIVVHVRDIAHEDSDAQRDDVRAVLDSLGLNGRDPAPLIEVWNKVDLLTEDERSALGRRNGFDYPAQVCSALTGEGCERLLETLDDILVRGKRIVDLDLSLCDGKALAWLYAHGEVLAREDDDEVAHLTVRLDPADWARFERIRA